MRFAKPCLLLCAACGLAACQAPPQKDAVASTQPAAGVSVPNNGLIPGTLPGDLGDWVEQIRSGIATLPAESQKDAPAAQRKAIQLYVSRQEYNEMYYGTEGRIHTNSPELGKAIETAEAHFHTLMRLLGTPHPARESVQAAVDALDAQQAHVAKLWKKTGAHINRAAQ